MCARLAPWREPGASLHPARKKQTTGQHNQPVQRVRRTTVVQTLLADAGREQDLDLTVVHSQGPARGSDRQRSRTFEPLIRAVRGCRPSL